MRGKKGRKKERQKINKKTKEMIRRKEQLYCFDLNFMTSIALQHDMQNNYFLS